MEIFSTRTESLRDVEDIANLDKAYLSPRFFVIDHTYMEKGVNDP